MRNLIRQSYFYAATFIFLIMSVIAAIVLLNLGLKASIFPKADDAYAMNCDEAALTNSYYEPGRAVMPDGSVASPKAPPTAGELASLKAACEQNLKDQKTAKRQRDLVQYLSVLLVAAPLFALHFKWAQKDRDEEKAVAAK